MEIGDRFQNLNESSNYLIDSDDDLQQQSTNLIDISESEIIFRNTKSSKSSRTKQDRLNYNSFQLSGKSRSNKYRTISGSSDESNLEINSESNENDSLLHSQEHLNHNKIQLNPIRE